MSTLVKASDGYGFYGDDGALKATWDLRDNYDYILGQCGEGVKEQSSDGSRPKDLKPKAKAKAKSKAK